MRADLFLADWTQAVDSTNESRLIFGRLDTELWIQLMRADLRGRLDTDCGFN